MAKNSKNSERVTREERMWRNLEKVLGRKLDLHETLITLTAMLWGDKHPAKKNAKRKRWRDGKRKRIGQTNSLTITITAGK